jgi:hypothetical protein
VNIQDAREWLRDQLVALRPATDWTISLSTWPELNGTVVVVIGHAVPEPDNFKAGRVQLPVTWWVNEANEKASVRDVYGALSGDAGSVVGQLRELSSIKRVTVTEFGPDQLGPTKWVRALSEVVVILPYLPPVPEEEIS